MVPQTKKLDQIGAARAVIGRCAFNQTLCEEGLDGLTAWEFEWNDDTGVFSREPIHNFASHPSDAFAYGCQVMQDFKHADTPQEIRFPIKGVNGRIVTATLDELWDMEETKRKDWA
jgi:phage terminase large subunit